MNSIIYGFTLSIIAGLSTMLGTIFIFIKFKNKNSIINASLSFAAGVMITVSFTDLLKESIIILSQQWTIIPTILISLIFVVVGILVSIFIDIYLPKEIDKSRGLYHIGIFLVITIIIHNIPEGIATFMTTTSDLTLGISLTIAIALHNIPEGISISIPIYYSTNSKKKALLYTFISGISEPFGALLAFIFLRPYMNDFILAILFSIIAGMMLYIALSELIPATKKYHNKKISYSFFILGSVAIIINSFL